MEESEKDTLASAHKRSTILFYVAIVGTFCTFLATGSFLIATGELKESLAQGKENDATLLGLSRMNNARIISIEMGNDRRTVIDSTYRIEEKKDREEIKSMVRNLQIRTSRLEWRLKLPPLDLQNDNSLKNKNVKPFGETTEKKNEQLTLRKQ